MPRLLHTLAKDSFCLSLLFASAVKKVCLWFPRHLTWCTRPGPFHMLFSASRTLYACMLFSASLASTLFPFQTLLTHYLIWEVCANLCLTCASLLNFINGIITTHFHSTIPARPEFVKGKMPTRSQVWALAHTGCSERVEMNWTQGTLISIQC